MSHQEHFLLLKNHMVVPFCDLGRVIATVTISKEPKDIQPRSGYVGLLGKGEGTLLSSKKRKIS
jgi:hypothetical protein